MKMTMKIRDLINIVEAAQGTPPRILYHLTHNSDRASIMSHGLLRSMSETAQMAKEEGEPDWEAYGGIFFSNQVSPEPSVIDVWEVNVTGLNLVRDETTDHEHLDEEWWVTWTDPVVEPSRLRLLTPQEVEAVQHKKTS